MKLNINIKYDSYIEGKKSYEGLSITNIFIE